MEINKNHNSQPHCVLDPLYLFIQHQSKMYCVKRYSLFIEPRYPSRGKPFVFLDIVKGTDPQTVRVDIFESVYIPFLLVSL